MADQYKKVIVPKENLPTLLTQSVDSDVLITGASVGSRLDGGDSIPTITYVTSEDHGLKTGDVVEISGVSPASLNVSATKVIVLSPVTFSVDKNASGTYTSGGTITKILSSYIVRYRIISEDRNRFSAWSPQYIVSPAVLAVDQYSPLTVVKSGSLLILTWPTEASAIANTYDVYVAWGSSAGSVGLTEYYTTISGNQATVPIPEGIVSAQIWIQSVAFPRKRVPDLTIASTNNVISVA
jgi:hypothetical protein